MIEIIIGIGFILGLISIGIWFARKRLKKDKGTKDNEYDKMFEKGEVLLPIDKRDFENLEEFEKYAKKIPKIKTKLDSIDEDFEKLEFVTEDRSEKDDE